MQVKKLKLLNFRNYSEQEIEFGSGVNVIYGDNAQGKTNILEAVHMFSMGKSNRTSKDAELIRRGEDSARIYMEFSAYGSESFFEIEVFRGRRKSIIYNDLPVKKSSELLGRFNVVYFGPELLRLVKDGPKGRRRNLDMLISQLRPGYFSALTALKRVVESKNALLKMQSPNRIMLDVMNEKLTALSAELISYRLDFIKRIERLAGEIQHEISSGSEELRMKYKSAIGMLSTETELTNADIAEAFSEKLSAAEPRELETGESVISPHREDILYEINGADARAFASQGQQKTIALVEKLAEVSLIREEINETPVLLLDDIMSELDRKRRSFVAANIKDIQIVITCTDIDEFSENAGLGGADAVKIYVSDGHAYTEPPNMKNE
ncbi:MAG TPA: DNA replication/repair protein RecF [Candidatus Monoglobus merdigallinarum]|uniref:DNA replication and repair protein RecF n=1 Tax=Candidatus Monoglobus merdigallinarum TaxID=2838698 RepID=A0A9D1TLQ4_9FIRM|nr:DNA replication/repair protein RecF [Candidatus Monoglobus merdigallinarum]